MDGVRQFLNEVSSEPTAGPKWLRRLKPLVAINIVGTGHGGQQWTAGEVVSHLLPVLYEAAERNDADIALVAYDGPALAAAQAARHQLGDPRSWHELEPSLLAEGQRLAAVASRGELALFLGAGVSASAGLPVWNGLLSTLAEKAGMSAEERKSLREFDPMDQAGIIEGRLGGTGRLQDAIREVFTWNHYSLALAFLAALPVREVVTMNYDQLFEAACKVLEQPVSVLPHAIEPGAGRWLLKMHGCVSRSQDIVLTREDYLGYAKQRAALAGIVQALLITRHMLFVGFSLTDDNFHRIADAVRRAVRSSAQSTGEATPFGTTLTLVRRPLVEELWKKDLRWVSMTEPRSGAAETDWDRQVLEAARHLEIFLDYLLSQTRDAAHLLDDRYAAVLSPEEQELRAALDLFEDKLTPKARQAPAWEQIARVLASLGRGSQAKKA
jgi:hypothetical protein